MSSCCDTIRDGQAVTVGPAFTFASDRVPILGLGSAYPLRTIFHGTLYVERPLIEERRAHSTIRFTYFSFTTSILCLLRRTYFFFITLEEGYLCQFLLFLCSSACLLPVFVWLSTPGWPIRKASPLPTFRLV